MKSLINLLFPLAFLLMIFGCDSTQHKAKWEPSVTPAYLNDSLPPSLLKETGARQLQGYRLMKTPDSYTYFFEYEANQKELLRQMARVPFAADSLRADVQCRIITDIEKLESLKRNFKEGLIARNFFLKNNLNDYTVYECVKSPQHHIIMLNKHSDNVIHVIQTM
jgi:hypothetical protein